MSKRWLNLLCVGAFFIGGAAWISYLATPSPPLPRTRVQSHLFALTGQVPGSKTIEIFNAHDIGLSPDGRTVAVWEPIPDPMREGEMSRFWDIATKQPVKFTDPRAKFANDRKSRNVHQTAKGLKGLLEDEGFSLQNIATGKIVQRFDSPASHWTRAWTFSPDGKRVWWADSQRIYWQSIE